MRGWRTISGFWDLAADDPWIVGLVGHVDPNREEFKGDIDRLAGNALFRGIRCGSGYFADLEAGSFLADMEHLVARDLELDALVGPADLAQVVELARRLPELRIVINHCGGVGADGGDPDPVWLDAIAQAAEQPQVFMKVSAIMSKAGWSRCRKSWTFIARSSTQCGTPLAQTA